MKVTLLGTGTPGADPHRFGPSTLVEAGSEKLIFDAGRGATIRLGQIGIDLADIGGVFITHFHSDHLNGLSDLWMSSYMAPTFRRIPLAIYGPPGIAGLARGLETAYKPDIDIRAAEYDALGMDFYPAGATFAATEFSDEGVVFDRGDVTVRAISVKHGSGTAFGYRVDYRDDSVVISGDTSISRNLFEQARGADLIIHEVMAVDEEMLQSSPIWQGIRQLHTTPEEAGTLFREVGAELAVYNHIGLVGVSEDVLVRETRKTYQGPLTIGEDLMAFVIDNCVALAD